MNQINGYCQIELPDHINLHTLNSAGVTLTDAEAKPIIKALNLDQVKADGEGYPSSINAWLNKPVFVSAYVLLDEDKRDAKSIFHASLVSNMSLSDEVSIQFIYDDGTALRHISIDIAVASKQSSIYMNWGIKVSAKLITTTEIA